MSIYIFLALLYYELKNFAIISFYPKNIAIIKTNIAQNKAKHIRT